MMRLTTVKCRSRNPEGGTTAARGAHLRPERRTAPCHRALGRRRGGGAAPRNGRAGADRDRQIGNRRKPRGPPVKAAVLETRRPRGQGTGGRDRPWKPSRPAGQGTGGGDRPWKPSRPAGQGTGGEAPGNPADLRDRRTGGGDRPWKPSRPAGQGTGRRGDRPWKPSRPRQAPAEAIAHGNQSTGGTGHRRRGSPLETQSTGGTRHRRRGSPMETQSTGGTRHRRRSRLETQRGPREPIAGNPTDTAGTAEATALETRAPARQANRREPGMETGAASRTTHG